MRTRGSAVIALAIATCACGRISFDPLGTGSADANRDGTTTADSATVPAGPRIWLQMETQPTVSIVDSAGGHAVSCAGGVCPTRDVGVHGFGYTFAMEQLNVANGADLDSSAGFSAAVWVNVQIMPIGVACFWTKSFDNAAGFDTFTLCIQADGTTVFDCESPTGVTDSENGPIVTLGQWHHLAMTWDGAIKRGYVDGVEVVTKPYSIGAGSDPAAVGGSRNNFYLQGTLDDALYYTRALTAAEVLQLATP